MSADIRLKPEQLKGLSVAFPPAEHHHDLEIRDLGANRFLAVDTYERAYDRGGNPDKYRRVSYVFNAKGDQVDRYEHPGKVQPL